MLHLHHQTMIDPVTIGWIGVAGLAVNGAALMVIGGAYTNTHMHGSYC
jgi:Co/Zn/Cd efflux system component